MYSLTIPDILVIRRHLIDWRHINCGTYTAAFTSKTYPYTISHSHRIVTDATTSLSADLNNPPLKTEIRAD